MSIKQIIFYHKNNFIIVQCVDFACMYVQNVCMYVCMYVCTYVCMHVRMYVRMYVCMYACTYVRMYACMYVCMYVIVHIRVCRYKSFSQGKNKEVHLTKDINTGQVNAHKNMNKTNLTKYIMNTFEKSVGKISLFFISVLSMAIVAISSTNSQNPSPDLWNCKAELEDVEDCFIEEGETKVVDEVEFVE